MQRRNRRLAEIVAADFAGAPRRCCQIIVTFVYLMLIFALVPAASAKDIQPPDVFQNTLVIRAELEEIRAVMGRPSIWRPEIFVRDAQPREVFFQAVTLWVKASRLCREARGGSGQNLAKIEIAPPRQVTPADVFTLTQNAMGRLICVKRELGLDGRAPKPPRDASKTPTDVFRSIVQANRQINYLLKHPFSASDALGIVSLSIEYVRSALDRVSPGWSANALPAPAAVDGKTLEDIHAKLIQCFIVAREIAERWGLSMLEFEPDFNQPPSMSDVFDFASLVFSEVRYLAAHAGIKKRYKLRPLADQTPSDVYRQVQYLEALLVRFSAVAHHLATRKPTN